MTTSIARKPFRHLAWRSLSLSVHQHACSMSDSQIALIDVHVPLVDCKIHVQSCQNCKYSEFMHQPSNRHEMPTDQIYRSNHHRQPDRRKCRLYKIANRQHLAMSSSSLQLLCGRICKTRFASPLQFL